MVLYCPNPRVRRALGGSVEAERGSLLTPLVLPCSKKNAICSGAKIFERSSFARGCGPRTKELDADRRPRTMGRRRDAGPRPGLLRGRQRRRTSAIEMGRRGPCSTDIARSSVWRLLTLCHDSGRDTTVHAHTVRVDHASPTPARIANRSGNPVDHGNRVRHVVACAAFDRPVSMVGRESRAIGTAVPALPARNRRHPGRHLGDL